MATRGFTGRRGDPSKRDRIPPGQYETTDFPVLSAGPTPRVDLTTWAFTLRAGDGGSVKSFSWSELAALPQTQVTVDIHCVTKWSKLDTTWGGVSVDVLLEAAGVVEPAPYMMAFCDGGYTTNVPTADLVGGRALIATLYDGKPVHPEHGGPARLLVPHLYFWKSAKWIRGLQFMTDDQPGFWERGGYHMRGDPWREERYLGD